MLSDLAALTPPFVVCAAFLIAVGAFLRHEMRRIKNPAQDEEADVSARVSQNLAEPGVTTRSAGDREGE